MFKNSGPMDKALPAVALLCGLGVFVMENMEKIGEKKTSKEGEKNTVEVKKTIIQSKL
jgi:hypothetical protein